MVKSLEVGKDYGSLFGLDKSKDQHMIYNGNDAWTALDGTRQMSLHSKAQTQKALEILGEVVEVIDVKTMEAILVNAFKDVIPDQHTTTTSDRVWKTIAEVRDRIHTKSRRV